MTPNPQPSPPPRQQQLARNTLMEVAELAYGIDRRSLRSLQRLINKSPGSQQRMGEFRDLRRLAISTVNYEPELGILNNLHLIANNLAIDHYTGENLNSTATAEAMYEAINHGNKIGTAIADELASCCEEIKYLSRQVISDIVQAKKAILRPQR